MDERHKLWTCAHKSCAVNAIVCLVAANSVGSFRRVGIDQPKGHVLDEEFIFKPLNLWDITVGNWAICREEENHNGRGSPGGQLGDRFAVEVVSVNRSLLSE